LLPSFDACDVARPPPCLTIVPSMEEGRSASVATVILELHAVFVGEVGLRKHHPRSATLATFGLSTASVSWGSLHCTGANKTLMPLMPCKFCCAGMIPRGGAYLRCRRYGWPCSGDEGPRGPGTRRAGRGHRVWGPWRHEQGARRGATPPVQDRCFVTEGATILYTWLPPTCKVSSGQGRDKGGRV
jgi:hypothetical protein